MTRTLVCVHQHLLEFGVSVWLSSSHEFSIRKQKPTRSFVSGFSVGVNVLFFTFLATGAHALGLYLI